MLQRSTKTSRGIAEGIFRFDVMLGTIPITAIQQMVYINKTTRAYIFLFFSTGEKFDIIS